MTRTAWVVIACFGLLVSPFLVGLAALLGSTASEGDIVSIRGLGNSGNTVYSAAARRRALKALGLDRGGPEVTDAMVRGMVVGVLERASKGEPEAVDFALELARVQREAVATPPTAAERSGR